MPQKRRAIGLSIGDDWNPVRGKCRLQTAQSTLSVGDNRRPQTTQSRGAMRSNSRCQKLIFFIHLVYIAVDTLADDVIGKATPQSKLHKFLVQFIVAGGLDTPALLLE